MEKNLFLNQELNNYIVPMHDLIYMQEPIGHGLPHFAIKGDFYKPRITYEGSKFNPISFNGNLAYPILK